MLLQRELLSLTIAAFAASSNVSAASDHHLRGSSDVANPVVEELPALLVDNEERQLKRGGNGGGRGGGGRNRDTTTTTTTTTTTVAAAVVEEPEPDTVICVEIYAPVCGAVGTTYSNSCYADAAGVSYTDGECKPTSGGAEAPLPTDGAAEEPTDGGDTTVTIIEAVCEPACDSGQVCAHEYSGATAQCYDRCSAFPLSERDVCTGTCVYSIFTSCNGYASVFDEYCECGNSGSNTYADGCRTSECGLGLFGRQ